MYYQNAALVFLLALVGKLIRRVGQYFPFVFRCLSQHPTTGYLGPSPFPLLAPLAGRNEPENRVVVPRRNPNLIQVTGAADLAEGLEVERYTDEVVNVLP
jgi:hypothetical protein